jgi:hypothetical protein
MGRILAAEGESTDIHLTISDKASMRAEEGERDKNEEREGEGGVESKYT